ncbi:YciI family protein [Dactylosporangium sp. NPDC048998]|uniref:YciI family protein n=1 Tax=Dactylosporangium sp. NPDC048998 TaxID=3363976 RepID=UPI00371D1798
MTKFLLLHARVAAPPPDLAGELLDARRLADPSLAVVVGAPVRGSFIGYWLIDVDSLERAVEIAANTGGPVEIRPLMSDGPGPDL